VLNPREAGVNRVEISPMQVVAAAPVLVMVRAAAALES
jgi:hypothetical protein